MRVERGLRIGRRIIGESGFVRTGRVHGVDLRVAITGADESDPGRVGHRPAVVPEAGMPSADWQGSEPLPRINVGLIPTRLP